MTLINYDVTVGYDPQTTEPIYDTILIPDTVVAPTTAEVILDPTTGEQASGSLGGGSATATDNSIADVSTPDSVSIAEESITSVTSETTTGGGTATVTDNTTTDVSTQDSVAVSTSPTITTSSDISSFAGYNTPPTVQTVTALGGNTSTALASFAQPTPVNVTLVAGTGTTAQQGQDNTFHSGDNFTLTVTGTPGLPVYVVQNNGTPFLYGTIQANGTFVAPINQWSDTNIGIYTQTWIVGNQSQTINFAVTGQGGGSSTTTDNRPSQVTTASATPTVVVSDATSGKVATPTQYGYFQSGDTFTATVSGKTGDTVTVTQTRNGITSAPYVYGVVGSDGSFIPPTHLWTDSDLGQYTQVWTIGTANVTINFEIGPQTVIISPPSLPPLPDPPTVSNSSVSVNQNYTVTFTFTAGNGATGITQISGPSFGKIQQVSAFQYQYIPRADYAGSDSIGFRSYFVDSYGRTVISTTVGTVNITVIPNPTIVRPSPISFNSFYNQASNVQINGSLATLGGGFPDTYYARLECVNDTGGAGSVSSLTASNVKNWLRIRNTTNYTYAAGVSMKSYSSYFGDTAGTMSSNTDDVAWFDTQTPASTTTVMGIGITQYPTGNDFEYTNFTTTNTVNSLSLVGAAGVGPSNVLRLVPAATNQVGSCFTSSKFPINVFSTYFRFKFSSLGSGGADGLTFTIQPFGAAIGTSGGGLGYGGISSSVAVKFDIFQNAGFDVNSSFAAVVKNGDVSTVIGSTYSPTNSLSNGSTWSAWVDYDGVTLKLYLAENSTTKPGSPAIQTAIDIPGIVGGSSAYVGFTAATSTGYANHDIIDWRYLANNSAPEVSTTTSRLYEGYFRAPATATYTFYLQSDDACYVWIGDTALSGYTKTNALVRAGGVHSINSPAEFNTISLVAGTYYPIRVAYGNYQSSSCALVLKYSTGTIAATAIPASQLFHVASSTVTSTTETLGNYIEVINGDTIVPVIMTPQVMIDTDPNYRRILTYRVTLTGSDAHPGWSGQTTTFQVGTAAADIEADAFTFNGSTGLELSTLYTTNTVAIQGMTPGLAVPVKVSPSANLIIDGVNTNNSTGTIMNGQTLAVQAVTSSAYLTPRSYIVTVGFWTDPAKPVKTSSFVLKTRPAHVLNAPWYFGDRTNLEKSTKYQTANTVVFAGLEGTATISINSGNVILNGGDVGGNIATIQNSDTVAFTATSSSSFNTPTTFTVTLTDANASPSVQTDSFTFTTRAARTTPFVSGSFINLFDQEFASAVTSNTLTLSDFDTTNLAISLSSADATGQLVINGHLSGTSNVVNSGDTIAITGTSGSDFFSTNSYTVRCGSSIILGWTVTTKSNGDLHIIGDF